MQWSQIIIIQVKNNSKRCVEISQVKNTITLYEEIRMNEQQSKGARETVHEQIYQAMSSPSWLRNSLTNIQCGKDATYRMLCQSSGMVIVNLNEYGPCTYV